MGTNRNTELSALVGKRLKSLRNEARMTQEEFSEFLDITFESYKKYEQGTRCPEIAKLQEISQKVKCDINYLIELNAPKNRNIADVTEETGLSEKAIKTLTFFKESDAKCMKLINYILENLPPNTYIALPRLCSNLSLVENSLTQYDGSEANSNLSNNDILKILSSFDFRIEFDKKMITNDFENIVNDFGNNINTQLKKNILKLQKKSKNYDTTSEEVRWIQIQQNIEFYKHFCSHTKGGEIKNVNHIKRKKHLED